GPQAGRDAAGRRLPLRRQRPPEAGPDPEAGHLLAFHLQAPSSLRWRMPPEPHPEIQDLIRSLALSPHPEGGFYRETFRSPLCLSGLPRGPRAASTAIYYLLPAGTFSALHRVAADEVWHHYDGDPVDLHLLDEGGGHAVARLGRDLGAGERPQVVVPA